VRRRIVIVRNGRGEGLQGILEEPPGARARLAAVLCSPGAKPRIGPHRLYRKLLPPFLERGIPVLRLDFAGLGDSEGAWPEELLERIYRRTELGHCADDLRSAFDWLAANYGIGRFVAGGLCGAAITALHAGARDARLAALYAIGLPPTVHGARRQAALPRTELRMQRTIYLRKMRDPRAWLRLLSLKSDFALMARLLGDALRRGRAAEPSPADPGAEDDFNPHLRRALLGMLGERRAMLLLYGDHDPLRRSFEERCLQPWYGELERHKDFFSYAVIPGAGHALAEPAAIAEANRLAGTWLDALLEGRAPGVGSSWLLRAA
jgi:alpha/beta superfamily hydrolase